ncbi:MAG: M23 family metallopeptidase, partial [Thiotrichaceae bacterium]
MIIKKRLKIWLILLSTVYSLGFIPQEQHLNPVVGASESSWNPLSFWYYPWGRSGTHKGIDIFAQEGTPVVSSTDGLVLYSGSYGIGGQVVYILSANWHFHYYAHMQQRR